MSLADLTNAQSTFRSALIEALQRTALILPDHWRWLQFESAWSPTDVTYNAIGKLSGYKVQYNSSTLTFVLTYNGYGNVASMQLTSSEGTVTVSVTYDALQRPTGTGVTFS
jgi:hypothetical protein